MKMLCGVKTSEDEEIGECYRLEGKGLKQR